jgi:hypothetical protein
VSPADDLLAAWRFYRLLRGWRDGTLAGHVWVRVELHPGQTPVVRPRRYVAARSPRRDCAHGIDMARACDACQGVEVATP